ncbi:MAG TPA: ATP-binding protein [Actinomycetota bacterium]
MKLLELEITNVRGIKSLVIRPQGQNLLIWGPNGSGKSAVVDSIDFLLTGKISRLMGPGTSGISLARHGPHIDATQAEAFVRAVVELPAAAHPVELRRCMDTADQLECDADIELLRPILGLAERVSMSLRVGRS